MFSIYFVYAVSLISLDFSVSEETGGGLLDEGLEGILTDTDDDVGAPAQEESKTSGL